MPPVRNFNRGNRRPNAPPPKNRPPGVYNRNGNNMPPTPSPGTTPAPTEIFVPGGTEGPTPSFAKPNDLRLVGDTVVGSDAGMAFGTSVSITRGKKIAIGAPKLNGYGGEKAGIATVYRIVGNVRAGQGEWEKQGQFLLGPREGDEHGTSVSISDNGRWVAVSGVNHVITYEWKEDSEMWNYREMRLNGVRGGVLSGDGTRLFTAGPTQARLLTRGPNDDPWKDMDTPLQDVVQGHLAWRGNRFVVVSRQGFVSVYEYWEAMKSYTRIGAEINLMVRPFDGGSAIAQDGRHFAVGGGNSVRIYKVVAGSWFRHGNTIMGTAADGDAFGFAIGISGLGHRIIIGSPKYNEGRGRSAVYTYDEETDKWNKITDDTHGKDPGDQEGYSVAMSVDGNYVASGAPATGTDRPGTASMFEIV